MAYSAPIKRQCRVASTFFTTTVEAIVADMETQKLFPGDRWDGDPRDGTGQGRIPCDVTPVVTSRRAASLRHRARPTILEKCYITPKGEGGYSEVAL